MTMQTALITGCSTGIGRQLTLAMLEAGYQVYATARRLDKLQDLEARGARPLELDVTCENSIKRAVAQIESDGNLIQVLINNAGYGAMGPLAEMPAQELEMQFRTNVFGPVSLVRHCVPHMRQAKQGLIVNLGSVSGILVTPFSGAYCATKSALHALSDAMRMELAPFNIRVMTVQPGAIESEFGNNAEASLQRTFSEQSLYAEVSQNILQRARASQNHPTPTHDFVTKLMQQMQKQHPPAVLKIGYGSRAFSIMGRWIPLGIRDRILSRTFGLSQWRSKLLN